MANRNANPGVPKLTRGRPFKVGTLQATNDFVTFSLSMDQGFSANFLIIQVPQGTVTTAVLDSSIDGGTTWGANPAPAVFAVTGQITGDTSASYMAKFDVSGMGSGMLFRFGVTAGTITASDVWAMVA